MADYSLTYAGIGLHSDAEQQLQEFLNRNQDLADLRDQCEPNEFINDRADRKCCQAGLPRPQYLDPPPPRLNHLWWPTGAARWARGYFVTNTAGKESIQENTSHGSTPGEFAFQSGGFYLETSLWLLPPRRITSTVESDRLWLLPLVDERYWWHYRSVNYTLEFCDTWLDLYAILEAALGVSIEKDAIASAYLYPDPCELSRPNENLALLLDAVAHSVGHRIVRQLDGTVQSMSWANSLEIYQDENSEGPWWRIAGGEAPQLKPVPEKVVVSYPKLLIKGCCPEEGQYEQEVNNPSDHPSVIGTRKSIFSTAYAEFCSGSPSNSSQLSDLATQIAADYYAHFDLAYDMSFVGVKAWKYTAYDDSGHYVLGDEYPKEFPEYATDKEEDWPDQPAYETEQQSRFERRLFHRIQSIQHNFAPNQQLSQGQKLSLGEIGAVVRVEVKSGQIVDPEEDPPVAAFGWLVVRDGASWVRSNVTVSIIDGFHRNFLMAGERVMAAAFCDSCQVEPIGENGLMRKGAVTGNNDSLCEGEKTGIDCDSTGEVEIYRPSSWNSPWSPGSDPCEDETDPGPDVDPTCVGSATGHLVDACNEHGHTQKWFNGDEVYLRWFPDHLKWHILPFPKNKTILATAGEDICAPGTYEMGGPVPLDYCVPGGIDETTIENLLNHRADESGPIIGTWDEQNCRWILIDVLLKDVCPLLDVWAAPDSNDPDCLVKVGMPMAAEFCQSEIPTEGCLIISICECPPAGGSGSGSGSGGCQECDLTYEFTTGCCGGSGSG